ncbi:RWD domain-containing protein 1 [Phlyctochytrium bullatum]|nr:RWD domain-containing protein 1 [Phlyctochytrium bullatum]
MDFLEEQTNELEALKSIFFEEFEELDAGPPAKFRLLVKPEETFLSGTPESEAQYYLEVTYTDHYPEAPPQLSITDASQLSSTEVENLTAKAVSSAEEQLGMAMIFGIHAAAKEHLEELLKERVARKEQEEEERLRREEEAERARYAGTKVTQDSFRAWKEKFLKEMEEAEKAVAAQAAGKSGKNDAKGRLSGRKLFEKDKSLAKSDVGMLQDGDVTVDIDQELFSAEFDGLEDEDEEENAVLAGFADDDD